MRPKNSPARTNAFVRFVVFYVITTVLIVAAVFFGLQVPFKENKQLQSQLQMVHREREFDRKLFTLISETRRMLDSVNNAGINTKVLEGRIDQNITAMDAMLRNDSTSAKTIYSELVSIFTDAKKDKEVIRAGSNKDETVRIKDRDIEELRKTLKDWQDAYYKQRDQLMQLQNTQ